MKYFAKYLPVDGEIKEGDKWWDGTNICDDWDSKEAWNTCNGKPVKLLLCSRDIQVGDECYIAGRNFLPPTYLATQMDFSAKYESIQMLKGAFKVIGEISPDALSFVTEGDEFDEEEIVVSRKPMKKYIENNPYCKIVNIKGPCGHFH